MSLESTFSIIKPDAVAKNQIGPIYARFAAANLWVTAARMQQLTVVQAERLYNMHHSRPFFNELVRFMTSGPVMLQVLSGEKAITRYRDLMGATNPQQAAPGTLRADFATSLERNAVHGSDSAEMAAYEISLFFNEAEIYPLQSLDLLRNSFAEGLFRADT